MNEASFADVISVSDRKSEKETPKKMISEESKKWIEAAKQLTTNPNAIIRCPECNKGNLKVNDTPIEEWNKIDRYMICDNCGKYNIITMSKPNQER